MADGEKAAWPRVINMRDEEVRMDAEPTGFLFVIAFDAKCEACKKDVQFWNDAAREAKDKKVSVLLLSTDENLEDAKAFVQSFGLTSFSVVFDRYREAARNFKITMVPQYYLFRGDGTLLGRWAGLSHLDSKQQKLQHPAQMFSLINSGK